MIMRRVAITGIGIVSSIGNNVSEVTDSLRNGTSGIVAAPEYTELGFRSQVHGTVKMDIAEHVDRKQLRFMGEGAAYAVLAMEQAIADAGLDDSDVSNVRSGLVAGSGGPSTANLLAAFDITREKGPKRIGPYMVPRCMSSTVSACIATFLKFVVLIIRFHQPVQHQRIALPLVLTLFAAAAKTSYLLAAARSCIGRYLYYLTRWAPCRQNIMIHQNWHRALMMWIGMDLLLLAVAAC